MATIISCLLSSSPSSFQHNTNLKSLLQFVDRQSVAHRTIYDKDKSYQYIHGVPKLRGRLQNQHTGLLAGLGNQPQISGLQKAVLVPEKHDSISENIFPDGKSCFHLSRNGGKSVVVPFCNGNEVISSNSESTQKGTSWFLGPAILVASFYFPPLFLPVILLNTFGDSPLTFFLSLFFTEAIFYCGAAVFFLLLDSLMRRRQPDHSANESVTLTPELGHQVSSVATLVLSITIPITTMVLAWQWAFPLVPTILVPYLVGIVVQFTFEHLARYWKSPSWAAISLIFHAYRFHQIHRAGGVLTYISFEARSPEFASKLPPGTLGILSAVLHLLLVICVWSCSSFLTRLLLQPSSDAKMI